jgi:4-methoxybenzoate monooxygenase (O-demethylating)
MMNHDGTEGRTMKHDLSPPGAGGTQSVRTPEFKAPAGAPVSDADPFSIDFFEDPHRIHDELREAGPVVWLGRYGVWAVARYREVHDVLHDWQTFCSSRGVGVSDFAKEKPWRQPSLLLETDPPEHDRARAVLNRILSPAVMKELRARVTAAAEAKARALLDKRTFDAIPDLARAFPLSVFPDAVGLRHEGREHLLPYAGLAFNAFGPDNELRRRALDAAAPHIAWVTEKCQRENLALGGLGAKVHAASDTGEITSQEAVLLVRSLLTAGIDTTVNSIGAAIYSLARFPDQWRKLHADPTLARSAFEEAVRFESPVQTFFRTTTCPVRIGDVELGEGQKVLMFLGAANRDPRRWENPDAYDIARRTSGHVGFGSGLHMCVGQFLARLEGEAMLGALARSVASIEISGTPKRAYNNTLRGLESLPITIHSKG